MACLFEATPFSPFAQRKGLGTLSISAVTPITSYFTVHKEEITVEISSFLKTSPEYEITGNVLNICVQWHMHCCTNMSNLNRERARKMSISVYLYTGGLETHFKCRTETARLKALKISRLLRKYFTLNGKKKGRINCNSQCCYCYNQEQQFKNGEVSGTSDQFFLCVATESCQWLYC